jgi:adenine-specific DNA-methyltransferase
MAHERLRPSFTFDEDRLNELKKIVPEAFADGKINWEALKDSLGDYVEDEEAAQEHFGLFWPGKRDARRIASFPSKGTLTPVYGEGLKRDGTPDSNGHNDSRNIFIEGENLEVLKILQKSYAGRIKMIYIDPPYNTGNDFVYDDNFTEPLQEYLRRTGQVDEEGLALTTNKKADGRFHSKWLSMMYPRLRLARNLLREDGFIIIHLDENEITNLPLLLNEIFGEENNIGTITWDKRNPKGDATGIAYQSEYILCYAKNKEILNEKTILQRPKRNAEKILNKADEFYKKNGKKTIAPDLLEVKEKYNLPEEVIIEYEYINDLMTINKEFSNWLKKSDFSGGERAYSEIDEKGDVYQRVSMSWPNKKKAPDNYYMTLLHPKTKKPCPTPARGWRYPEKTLKELLKKKQIIFGMDESTQPRRKYLLKENMNENIPSILPFGGSDDKFFNKCDLPFDNPKPFKFSAEIIKYFTSPGDIVVDFFAGSGTTGHAVMNLNSEKNNRNFILVQFDELVDEKSIAYKKGFRRITEITQKRLVICSRNYSKISNGDFGFRKYKLDFSNYKEWINFQETNIRKLEMQLDTFESPLRENWSKDGLLTETILLEGFPLDSTIDRLTAYTANKVGKVTSDFCDHALLICFDVKIQEVTIKQLDLGSNDIFICLDSAINDQEKLRLSDKGMIKTI